MLFKSTSLMTVIESGQENYIHQNI